MYIKYSDSLKDCDKINIFVFPIEVKKVEIFSELPSLTSNKQEVITNVNVGLISFSLYRKMSHVCSLIQMRFHYIMFSFI